MPTSAENVREYYRKQGEQREQQRIIELLEKNANTEQHYAVGFYESDPLIYLDEAIALIKKEIADE